MSYFADTNILLRFLLKNEPEYPIIRRAVNILKARRERIFTAPQNIAEFWNVCTRPATARGGIGLSVEATERRLRLIERHSLFWLIRLSFMLAGNSLF
jgi:predicted nucleic acid-binding protein